MWYSNCTYVGGLWEGIKIEWPSHAVYKGN